MIDMRVAGGVLLLALARSSWRTWYRERSGSVWPSSR